MVRNERLAMKAQDAVEELGVSLKKLCEDADLKYNTVMAWRAGRRTPSPENVRKLAQILEERSVTLHKLARDLEWEASRTDTPDSGSGG